MKKRIWELDALRGLCILGVIVVHLLYDISSLYDLVDLHSPVFNFIALWGGTVFLVLSGICVTLGSHPIRRGLIVFGCGLGITAVTVGMYLLGLQGRGIIIWFGVLHCLGLCMLMWPLFDRLPCWVLGLLGGTILLLGHGLVLRADHPWLVIIGFTFPGFSSGDYFPLLPNMGYFLLGGVLGKTLYRSKQSLFPKVNPQLLPIRFLIRCGKLSLPIYLIHQPLLTGLIWLFLKFF